jgi:hypothetical protein
LHECRTGEIFEIMNANRIDFISSYCDRWCERCSFTSRCSLFAVQTAIAMCGDVADGIELAVGRPPDEPHAHHSSALFQRIDDLEDSAMTRAERLEFDGREQDLNSRVDDTTIMYIARAFSVLAHQWLTARADTVRPGADHVMQESLEITAHDALFISAKLHRALSGGDPHERSDDESHPVQSDWNGSAKVALISIERSEAAWRVIADATGEETPAMLADELRNLRREVETVFPKAWSFVRPGFDEPWR